MELLQREARRRAPVEAELTPPLLALLSLSLERGSGAGEGGGWPEPVLRGPPEGQPGSAAATGGSAVAVVKQVVKKCGWGDAHRSH